MNIVTRHSPWSYTQQQVDTMLYVHAHMPAKSVTYIYELPQNPCGDDCNRCAFERERP